MANNNKKGNVIVKDIVALLTLSVSLFLLISLLSYDPHDATWLNDVHSALYHNMGGKIGANIAELLFQIFGLSGYVIGVLGIMIFFAMLFKDTW